MNRRWTPIAIAVAALTLPIMACDDGPAGADDARLSILLTDDPGDVSMAVVHIEEIYLQGEGDDGRVMLREEPDTTDLLTLVNDVKTLVDEASVPAGTYSQLRFVIREACIVGEGNDGETGVYATSGFEECGPADGSLTCPSCDQTGIKVNLPGGAVTVSGDQNILMVDFKVDESFDPGVAGESGMWVMTPVVQATEFQLTAGIVVSVSLADGVTLPEIDGETATLADFEVALSDAEGGDEGSLELTESDEEGVYQAVFRYLDPTEGPFDVALDSPDGVTVTTDPESPATVEVASGQDASISFTVTEASGS